jgi:hypothetical protein
LAAYRKYRAGQATALRYSGSFFKHTKANVSAVGAVTLAVFSFIFQ